jgi:hypothetical protein
VTVPIIYYLFLKGMKMIKKTFFVILIATMLIALIGCCYPRPSVMRSDGMPQDKYLVGGGFSMKYVAPVDGTVYVVDSVSRRMLVTESLEAGETFDQSLGPIEQTTKEGFQALGLDLSKARLQLYFVPDADMPMAKAKIKTSKACTK